jgi:hypothetical protein
MPAERHMLAFYTASFEYIIDARRCELMLGAAHPGLSCAPGTIGSCYLPQWRSDRTNDGGELCKITLQPVASVVSYRRGPFSGSAGRTREAQHARRQRPGAGPYRATAAQLADALELDEDARRCSSRQRAAPKLLPLPRWKQRVTRCPTLCCIQSSPCLPFARPHSVNNNEIVTARTADQ